MQAARQARRAMLASGALHAAADPRAPALTRRTTVVALPLLAARSARAEEEAAADVDIRALILSTILMGVAGFTAVGAASTPKSGACQAARSVRIQAPHADFGAAPFARAADHHEHH